MPAVGPRIVVRGEVGAVLHAGMAKGPELDEGIGIGIFQPCLAQMVEGGDDGVFRIGDKAVNRLLPVDVGLMLEVAAEGVACRFKQEARKRKRENQNQKTLSAGERVCLISHAQLPARAAAAGQPSGQRSRAPNDKEETGGHAGQLLRNVMQNIMPALVAEDEEDLVVGQPVGGRIPHHKALGRTDAGHIGIQSVGFCAGLHQIHSLRCDPCSGACDDGLQFGHQRGMSLNERFEFVEERIDEWRGKGGEQNQRQLEEPDSEPVTARVSAHQPIEEQQHGRDKEQ